MYCSSHLRVLVLIAAALLSGHSTRAQVPSSVSRQSNTQPDGPGMTANLRWDPRPGVFRYRLQLALDVGFADIVFDRVVTGNQRQIIELPPGKYFWRIAPLTKTRGDFSSVRVIEVHRQTPPDKTRQTGSRENQSVDNRQPPANSIAAGGGWRTAVGDISYPVPAHLRSRDRFDIVAVNSEGATFALEAASGVSLWSARRTQQSSMRVNGVPIPPLIVRARSGLDNVMVLYGATVTKFEGATGRELWHAALPAAASSGVVMETARGSLIFIVDNSLQRMFLLDGADGNIVSQVRLPQRVVGGPATFIDQSSERILLAFANGRIEVRDESGAVTRSGDAGSLVTTRPLFVKGSSAALVMIGTKNGLTALNADDLRPLGRVAIKDDAPRGTLASEDLNGDGSAEVLMVTERGRVVAVNAADGQILWNADVGSEAESMTFADVNGDGVMDVVVATSQVFALVISGRDGSIVWKDSEDAGLAANHATSLAPRSIVALSSGRNAVLVSGDASRTGLRAVELLKSSGPPKH
jgi:outer membrane protein assembly factor BamB